MTDHGCIDPIQAEIKVMVSQRVGLKEVTQGWEELIEQGLVQWCPDHPHNLILEVKRMRGKR